MSPRESKKRREDGSEEGRIREEEENRNRRTK